MAIMRREVVCCPAETTKCKTTIFQPIMDFFHDTNNFDRNRARVVSTYNPVTAEISCIS